MRDVKDLYVGRLFQDCNDWEPVDVYYVDIDYTGATVEMGPDLEKLGVPTGVLRPSMSGLLGSVYTCHATGESYFIAE